jgi:hypothetical protein
VSDSAAIVGAVAACAAAALSGGTLWITGHREERKWRRDAVVETTCQFLDASYRRIHSSTARAAWRNGDLQADLERKKEAYDAQRSALTRLRLLAPTPVVAEAEKVLVADGAACDAIFGPDSVGSGQKDLPRLEQWERLQEERRIARQGFLDAFRTAAGLGAAKTLASKSKIRS